MEAIGSNLVLLPDVLAMLRISYGTLHRRIKDGKFPPPLAGRKSLAWRRADIERTIATTASRKAVGAAP